MVQKKDNCLEMLERRHVALQLSDHLHMNISCYNLIHGIVMRRARNYLFISGLTKPAS